MTTYVPKGQRPPGAFPAAPRVIYRTKRKNLSHEGRIGRIDRQETLDAFRSFSDRFHGEWPRLDPEQGGYLHNHGFFPDKGALYGLPNEGLDTYLSDFQQSILPLANGLYHPTTSNRLLSWPVMTRVLPLAPQAATWQRGRVFLRPDAGDGAAGCLLARPADTTRAPVLGWHERLPDMPEQGPAADRLFLRLPDDAAQRDVIRIAAICDPENNQPAVLAGIRLEAGSGFASGPGETVTCRRIDPETGIAGAALRFVRGSLDAPEILDDRSPTIGGWWPAVTTLVAGLLRLPIWTLVQLDIMEIDGAPVIIDLTDQLDGAALQAHGPIMGSEPAIRFIREYGV